MKPGSLVLQKNTILNNNKDNKPNRMSVVLFEFLYNDEEYVCTCPVTNYKPNINNYKSNYLYMPYEILSAKKYCSVKLSAVNFYPKNEIIPCGLNISNNTLLKIYNGVLDVKLKYMSLNLGQCKILKKEIVKVQKDLNKSINKKTLKK